MASTDERNSYNNPMQPRTEPPRQPFLPPQDGGWKNVVLTLLGTLMFGGMLAAAVAWTVPVLVSDWQIRDAAVPVAGSRVTKGKCSSRVVLHICDATLSVVTKSGRVSRDVNYVFAGFNTGDFSVAVLADPARPELATTDLALDRLWNRTLTLLVVGGILLVFTIAPILALIRRLRAEPS